MTNSEKILVGAMVALTASVVGLAFVLLNLKLEVNPGENKTIALGATESRPTYISQDATGMNDLYEYGDLEVAGTTYLRGDTRATTMVKAGSVTAKTVTTSLSAAEVCNSGLITATAATTVPTYTFPATTTLFADCLTTNGDSITIPVANLSAVTTTILAAGAGGTAFYSSTLTLGTSDTAIITLIRNTASTYLMLVTNQPS